MRARKVDLSSVKGALKIQGGGGREVSGWDWGGGEGEGEGDGTGEVAKVRRSLKDSIASKRQTWPGVWTWVIASLKRERSRAAVPLGRAGLEEWVERVDGGTSG